MIFRRTLIAALAGFFVTPTLGFASEDVLSATRANVMIEAGELILIDIRRPDEWEATGVAKGAWPLDMRQQAFGGWLIETIARNPDRRIAIICRTGNRSGQLQTILKKNNINDVLDVSEGMVGGPNGKGWIASGLPVVSAAEAIDAMPKNLTAD
ncbi:rhodanese-like domain-containing protein [Shimia biformata]|uniref:rhodanese-like domain-containing protein n=1 Tax=Shimia biformata TaxID=1294299 RepID=UPI00194E9EB4|nr:rhodanese-like domain-containing protein [Shimia biformata]